MKNLYKEYQKKKDILDKSFLLLSNGSEYMAFNSEAERISRNHTTNLITKPEYTFTIFGEEKFHEVMKNGYGIVSVAFCDFDNLGNPKR